MSWKIFAVVSFLIGSGVASASEPFQTITVKAVQSKAQSCPGRVQIRGYVHSSRHGFWMTDNAGWNGPAIGIVLYEKLPERQPGRRIVQYLHTPAQFLNSSLRVSLYGRIVCDSTTGIRNFIVYAVRGVEITPIRDP